MRLRLVRELPVDAASYWFEPKWDGFRAVAFVDAARVRLQSKQQRDLTPLFPELAPMAAAVGRRAVIDGEVIALGDDGRPSFQRLQQRSGLGRGPRSTAPVSFVAFDLLALDGRDLTRLPLEHRRELLDGLALRDERWNTTPQHEDGAALLRATRVMGIEGVVAKRRGSPYVAGPSISGHWLKLKHTVRGAFVIGGWLPGAGADGGLLLGEWDGGRLRYVGRAIVGPSMVRALLAGIESLRRASSPFAGRVPAGAVFFEPRNVADIEYLERTGDGRLRHGVLRGVHG